MVGKYKVITLCGSTRFKEHFLEAQKRQTKQFAFCGNLYTFASEGERVYEFAPFSLLKPS